MCIVGIAAPNLATIIKQISQTLKLAPSSRLIAAIHCLRCTGSSGILWKCSRIPFSRKYLCLFSELQLQYTTQQCIVYYIECQLPRFQVDLIQDGDFVNKATFENLTSSLAVCNSMQTALELRYILFWKRNEQVYPHLSILARVFLTPSESSVPGPLPAQQTYFRS